MPIASERLDALLSALRRGAAAEAVELLDGWRPAADLYRETRPTDRVDSWPFTPERTTVGPDSISPTGYVANAAFTSTPDASSTRSS